MRNVIRTERQPKRDRFLQVERPCRLCGAIMEITRFEAQPIADQVKASYRCQAKGHLTETIIFSSGYGEDFITAEVIEEDARPGVDIYAWR